MGKIYQFECELCGYRAAVAGGASEGRDLKVQTVVCRECHDLQDCVTAIRTSASARSASQMPSLQSEQAPAIAQALSRLPTLPRANRKWHFFDLACPRDTTHHVKPWNAPARCPRCKAYLEPAALPYQVWD